MAVLNNRRSGLNEDIIPSRRALLVFKHNAKAGGESTMQLLNQLKNFTYHVDHLKESIGCRRVVRGLPKRNPPRSKIRRGFDVDEMQVSAKDRLSKRAKKIPSRRVQRDRMMPRGQKMRLLLSEDDDVREYEGISSGDLDSELLREEWDQKYFVEGRNCTNKYCVDRTDCEYSINDLGNRNDALVYISEFNTAKSTFQRAGFVISSMREPCDQYLSLWAYGSSKQGALYNSYKQTQWSKAAYGKDAPKFDSPRDISTFRQVWLKSFRIRGIIGRRHSASYGVRSLRRLNGRDHHSTYHVDCWIFLDDYDATLYDCLRQYEAQGGLVNWNAPLLSTLVRGLQEKIYSGRRRLQSINSTRIIVNYTKNDPLNNIQDDHHAKCSKYYDDQTAALVTNGTEKMIYEHFGYTGCCGDRLLKKNLTLPPHPLEGVSSYNVFVQNMRDGATMTADEIKYYDVILDFAFRAIAFCCFFIGTLLLKRTRLAIICLRGCNRRKRK